MTTPLNQKRAPASVAATLYRQVLKGVSRLQADHGKRNVAAVNAILFGPLVRPDVWLNARTWSTKNPSVMDVTKAVFRRDSAALQPGHAIERAFYILRRLQLAAPKEENTDRVRTVQVETPSGSHFAVRCFVSPSDPPDPQNFVPPEPFYAGQLVHPSYRFPFVEEAVGSSVCATRSVFRTNKLIEVECATSYEGLAETDSETPHRFEYKVTLRHVGPSTSGPVILLSRHWCFLDLKSHEVSEVTGAGVVGNFPMLSPGETYTYCSGTSMANTEGIMRGTFQMALLPRSETKPTADAAEVDLDAESAATEKKGRRRTHRPKRELATFAFDATVDTTVLSITEGRAMEAKVKPPQKEATVKAPKRARVAKTARN